MTQRDASAVHLADQLTGYIRDNANRAAIYFNELVGQGLTRAEALTLTSVMVTEYMRGLYAPGPSPRDGSES